MSDTGIHIAAFDAIPQIEGELVFDKEALTQAAADLGNIRFAHPGAVLRPAAVADIARMVAYCHHHGIPVTARGTGHAMHGQALVEGGLIIDMTELATIHSISIDGGADVDAGVLWSTLVNRAAEQNLAFPCLTGYLDLTIAGTLSVGGIGGSYTQGAQIDHVRAVQVVTGSGDTVWCNRDEHKDLFDAVLGGLGQFGIITRVVLDLVPAPDAIVTLRLPYVDPGIAIDTMNTLIERREFDQLFCMVLPLEAGAPPAYVVTAVLYHDPANGQPDVEQRLREIPPAVVPIGPETSTYLEHATQYTAEINQLRLDAGWDQQVKPWFDVFVSSSAIHSVVNEIIAPMPAETWSPGSFVLLFPQLRDRFTQPQLRLPNESGKGDEIVYLLDILDAYPQQPGLVEEKERRNEEWFHHTVKPRGGVRYPIGVLRFGLSDWQAHYGDRWADLRQLKERYDPGGLLARGQGIFSGPRD